MDEEDVKIYIPAPSGTADKDVPMTDEVRIYPTGC